MSVIFTCSIDDGHPSDMKMAELLDKHRLNGTFFIPIKNREGAPVMSAAQIRDLAGRFEVGSHTYDHCFLKSVDIAESHFQVTEGKKHLENILGRPVAGFCYPGGKYRAGDVEIVKAAGFKYARTTVNLCFDVGRKPFEMPTTVQIYPHARDVYFRNFTKSGDWLKRQNGLRITLSQKHWVRRLHELFDYAADHDGCFHLWGHSKDIDDLNAWADVDRFLASVADRVPFKNRLTNEQLAARYF